MFEPIFDRHREMRSQRAEEGFDGFTLIELLIVIVVLAILAATVIFALGGVTSSSAKASCDSDAKSVEVAVEAYKNFPGNADAWPGASTTAGSVTTTNPPTGTPTANTTSTNAALTGSTNGGPFLRTYPPGNSHYYIANDAGGKVYVWNGTVWKDYDSTTDPCSTVP